MKANNQTESGKSMKSNKALWWVFKTEEKKTRTGIELRFSKGRGLKILSYAVYVNGVCHVDHATTRANERAGIDLSKLVKIEQERNPKLKIL